MNKKTLSFLLTILLVYSTLSTFTYETKTTFAVENNETDLVVSAEILYLREGPALSYPVLTTLTEGQELQFIAKEGDWYHVKVDGEEGWVASWLTSSKKNTDQVDQTVQNKHVISQVNYLNLRAEPSLTAAVLTQLHVGDQGQVLQQKDAWVQIYYNGTTGWVSTDYVSITNNISTTDNEYIEEAPQEEPSLIEPPTTNETNDEIDPNTFTVTVDAVYIRKKADLSSKKLGTAEKGQQFEVLDRDNNWIQIQFGDSVGWIYSFYGTFNVNKTISSEENNETATSSSENFVKIIYEGTNLRESATTSSDVVLRASAGEQYPIVATHGDWFEVQIEEDKTAFVANWVVSLDEESPAIEEDEQKPDRKKGTLKGLTIVVDPGHGGNDMGTTGVRGTEEKDINLKTVELLKSKLRAAGAEVILTRESDVYVDLRKRVSISHQYAADAFISIHYDATEDSSISGFTTYYTNGYQQPLAQYVHEGLAQKVELRDRGVQPGNYLVLRENKQNAILIELGYLSNPNEERIVTSDYYREQATLGIYQGILNYFDSQLEE